MRPFLHDDTHTPGYLPSDDDVSPNFCYESGDNPEPTDCRPFAPDDADIADEPARPTESRIEDLAPSIAPSINTVSLYVDQIARADARLAAIAATQSKVDTARLRVFVPNAPPCSDSANCNRITQNFGFSKLISMGGKWYTWAGTHWQCNDLWPSLEMRMSLPALIKKQADRLDADNEEQAGEDNPFIVDTKSLHKWAEQSAGLERITAAEKLAKVALDVPAGLFDSNPMVLNCSNGTVDLRTGDLRPHDPGDYITYVIPYRYLPRAKCPNFIAALRDCMMETETTATPKTDFLQRWFGYASTGLTSEQKLLTHWGKGANGKTTILSVIDRVLGPALTGTATPGLLVEPKNERHPEEIAVLRGIRLLTAPELGEGHRLREDLVKQMTGGDALRGRFMHGSFFTFIPTMKIQVVTNHKPAIKGTDDGIWRRVLLLLWGAKFGSQEQVEQGKATHIKNPDLYKSIMGDFDSKSEPTIMDIENKTELCGVLAWIVEGAIKWHQIGLSPPQCVLASSADYKRDEDRIGGFIDDVCDVGALLSDRLIDGDDGIYPAYRRWCKESGILPQSKQKFLADLLMDDRFEIKRHNVKRLDGQYRKQSFIHGLKIQ